jgi:hypothetical protein
VPRVRRRPDFAKLQGVPEAALLPRVSCRRSVHDY